MTIKENPSASLIDIGDGVACLEFHTKMNSIDPDMMKMISEGCDIVNKDFQGMVVANHDQRMFSAGANLFLPAALVRAGRGAEARAIAERLEREAATRYVSPVERLCAWAALDERERCRALFADAERERCPPFAILTFAPGFLALAPDWLRERFARQRVAYMSEIRRAAADLA